MTFEQKVEECVGLVRDMAVECGGMDQIGPLGWDRLRDLECSLLGVPTIGMTAEQLASWESLNRAVRARIW